MIGAHPRLRPNQWEHSLPKLFGPGIRALINIGYKTFYQMDLAPVVANSG